jgi:nitrogen fixation NifU-like protein
MYCLGKGLVFLSKKVMERFRNPTNVGAIRNADGVGQSGDPSLGSYVKLYIKVKNSTITDARFKAFGSAATIATASVVSEMLEGKSIEQASAISWSEIAEALGGLPPSEMSFAELGHEAVRSAVDDFVQRRGHLDLK